MVSCCQAKYNGAGNEFIPNGHMKEIIPFQNTDEALPTLDNGGRFYNLLTKADAGHISAAELAKVAGVYTNKQQMVLYFAMTIADLADQEKQQVQAALSQDLKTAYKKYAPQSLPSGIISSSAIITGTPKMAESKSELCGFVMVPVTSGKSITFTMVPIMEQYDVYEIKDQAAAATFLIAHARGSEKLPEQKIRVGGILKEIKVKKHGNETPGKFLESLYYSRLHENKP